MHVFNITKILDTAVTNNNWYGYIDVYAQKLNVAMTSLVSCSDDHYPHVC